MSSTLSARCLCNAANHTLTTSSLPLKVYICNCTSCRHTTGCLYLPVAFLPKTYQPSPSVLSNLSSFPFSPRINYYFCPTCGSHMLADCLEADGSVYWCVMTGTLERVEGTVEWKAHEHVRDTIDGGFADWFHGEEMVRWAANYHDPEGEKLPLKWMAPDRPTIKPSPDDKLYGHCKCKGVEFWISRPTNRSAVVHEYSPGEPPAHVPDSGLPPEEESYYLRSNRSKYLAGLCACNSCRLASGVELTPWAFVPAINISLSPDSYVPWKPDFGTLKRYQSTSSPDGNCYRYFCSTCGAICFFDKDGRSYLKDIAIGLFDAAEGAKAESWFGWRTSRIGYRDDAIPRAESFVLAVEKGLREWEERREGEDESGGSKSAGAL